jgi:hypothetical protein
MIKGVGVCGGVMKSTNRDLIERGQRRAFSRTSANLDPYSTTFAHRDGVDFVFWQGARRARCFGIVIDKQRRQKAKAARPGGVVFRKPLNFVVCLRVAPLRGCAALLVSGFLKSITVCKCGRIRV